MTWERLMEVIEIEGTPEELELMKPRELTITELAELLGVTPIRIYQLQKRKKNPLPLVRNEDRPGRNVWTIKEIPLLEWIDKEEDKKDSRKKVDYSRVHEYFEDIFQRREEIIDRYIDRL